MLRVRLSVWDSPFCTAAVCFPVYKVMNIPEGDRDYRVDCVVGPYRGEPFTAAVLDGSGSGSSVKVNLTFHCEKGRFGVSFLKPLIVLWSECSAWAATNPSQRRFCMAHVRVRLGVRVGIRVGF